MSLDFACSEYLLCLDQLEELRDIFRYYGEGIEPYVRRMVERAEDRLILADRIFDQFVPWS